MLGKGEGHVETVPKRKAMLGRGRGGGHVETVP